MSNQERPRRLGRPPRLSIEERSAAVLDAAVAQFGAATAAPVSMESVADAAGIQKPALYRLYPSKADLYRASVEREVLWFADATSATFEETSSLPSRERIVARAGWIIATVRARPSTFRLLLRALHSWPDDDWQTAVALRRRVLQVMEGFAAVESRGREVAGPAHAAHLIAASTFALTVTVVESALTGGIDDETLARFLAEAMEGCVVAAFSATTNPG